MSDAAAARAMLARRVLDPPDEAHTRVGAFTLRAEQRRTLAAVRAALEEFGGALLADPPGTGKTIVALAVAAVTTAPARGDDGARTLVVAPATLRAQWAAQAARAGVPITFRSLESLSRGAARERPGLVIVDEAHHLREPATRRHAHLAGLCEGTRVLLRENVTGPGIDERVQLRVAATGQSYWLHGSDLGSGAGRLLRQAQPSGRVRSSPERARVWRDPPRRCCPLLFGRIPMRHLWHVRQARRRPAAGVLHRPPCRAVRARSWLKLRCGLTCCAASVTAGRQGWRACGAHLRAGALRRCEA